MTLYNNKTNGKLCVRKKDTMMWLFLVMLTLPHMKPPFLDRIPAWEMLFNGWRLVSFTVVVFWVLVVKRKISMIVFLISVWEVFLFITTALHQGEIYNSAVSAFSVLSIAFLYDVAHDKGEVFLSAQLFTFETVIYINLITEILYPRTLFPSGMYVNQSFPYAPNWFLGYYNGYTKYFIPALMFAWLYKEKTKKKGRAVWLLSGILFSAVLVFAGGLAFSLAVIIIVYSFLKNRTRIFNYFTYWLIHIIFFFGIVIFKLQNLFFWLINDILGKWHSLIGRMTIWDRTLPYISESPLIGHGVQSSVNRMAEYHMSWAIHSHNMLLEILYQGGFVGLILWILLVVLAGMPLFKNRNAEVSKIISTAFLGWCVATLVEPFTSCFLIGMFVIAYYSNSVLGSAEDHTERRTKKTRSAARELSGS